MITGPRDVVKRARKLRSEMTLPEAMQWRELRQRPGGFKFRRQHPSGVYVIDFYCASLRLAIEVDGFSHDSARAARADEARSAYLRSQHVATMRIPARAILSDLAAVVARIGQVSTERAPRLSEIQPVPLHQPAAGPPPRAGEDFHA